MLQSAFLQAQPAELRQDILTALRNGQIAVAMLLFFDFATGAVRLCNRTVPVVDGREGRTWEPLRAYIAFDDISGAPNNWAPARRYSMTVPVALLERFGGEAGMFPDLADKTVYQDRAATLSLQLLKVAAGASGEDIALGYPCVLHSGLMDRIEVAMTSEGVRHDLYVEGVLARKRVPGNGRLNPRDQKRLSPGDLGLDYVPEIPARPVRWPKYSLDYVARTVSAPFAWGTMDCVMWATGAVQAVHGVDPVAHLRGAYDGPAGAARILREAGGLERLLDQAMAGFDGPHGLCLAIEGKRLVAGLISFGWPMFKTEAGLTYGQTAPLRVWGF